MIVDDLAGQVDRDGERGTPVPGKGMATKARRQRGELVTAPSSGVKDGELGAGHRVPGGGQCSGVVSDVEARLAVAGLYVEVVGLIGTRPVDEVVDVPARAGQAVELGTSGHERIRVVPLVISLGG